MKRFSGIVVLLLWLMAAKGQECGLILSGHIEDADTKEKLAGATISIKELHQYHITDANGDFRLTNICPGTYNIQVSHAGCQTVHKTINLTKNHHIDVLMPHLRYNLQEVVVEGRKIDTDNGYRAEVGEQQLEASRNTSIAEALSNINGVNLLQTGSSISKPVIHGLHGTRVLTINNGIRQEGQQWGNEHAPEIDTYVADKLTVVKGTDALRYGSDAIGGAVLIDPKPVRAIPGYNMEFNGAYATNNNQYAVSAIFEHQPENLSPFSYRLQGTIKKAANVKTPGYRLKNTAMNEENFSIAAGWKKEHYQLQAYYSQFSTNIGIFPGSHIGNLTDLLNMIEQVRPNDVFLGENSYNIKRPRQEVLHRLVKIKGDFEKNKHRFSVVFGGQYNHRDEYNVVRNPSNTRPQVSLAVITTSEELVYEHPAFHHIKGSIGLTAMQQDNSYSGRYLVPNYLSQNYGAYWIEKWSRKNWEIGGGIRYDDKSIETKRLRFNGERIDHAFNFETFASSLHAGYRINNETRIILNGSITSRAPHVNELLVDGIHEGAGTYELGDINLVPEKSLNLSATFTFQNSRKNFSAEWYGYYNRINDFIYQQPQPSTPVLTIAGAFPLFTYQQTDALLKGMDASVKYSFNKNFEAGSRISVLRAKNRATDDWLILMPSDRWRNDLVYRFNKGKRITEGYVSAEVVSVFAPKVPSDAAGKQDYKEPPAAYSLFNLNASATAGVFKTPITFTVAVRNLLNKSYRDYMNSFRYYTDEMGRNVTLLIKVPLINK